MISKKKICVVTGTRAEYGLLYWLMKEIQATSDLQLQVIATGMHLSPEFGYTLRDIEQDGFVVDDKIEILLSSDTDVSIAKSIGLGVIGFSGSFDVLKPDMILVLGDRFEIFAAATAAMVAKIPIVHLHGGEVTEGAYDEAFRHSITKMSFLHFTASEEYRRRVLQLGEDPDRVFNVGALCTDNIQKLNLLSKKDFEESINFELGCRNLLITYHPETLDDAASKVQFFNLLSALDELRETRLIFTKANADSDGRIINRMIDDYVKERCDKAVAYQSLGHVRYLSAMKYVDGVVGNSSSGLLEAPSFNIGTINIGDRQKGRVKSESVIDCSPTKESISAALRKLYSGDFQKRLERVESPHGNGGVAEDIVSKLMGCSLVGVQKKKFYDIG